MTISSYFTLAALVLTLIFISVVALKTRRGMKNGAYIQPLSLLTVVLSAITAFILMSIAGNRLFGTLEEKTMAELLELLEGKTGISFGESAEEILLSFNPEAVSYVLAIPIAILAPIIFLLLYIIAKALFSIIFKICKAMIKIPKRVDTVGKAIGGVLGAVEGILVMIVFCIPLTSLLNLSVPIMAKLDIENETFTEISDGATELSESAVIKLVSLAGGDFLADELTYVGSANNKIDVKHEILSIIDLVNGIMEFAESSHGEISEMLTPENEKLLDSILQSLEGSDYMPMLLAGAIHILSDSLFSNLPAEPTESQDKFMLSIKSLLDTSTEDTVIKDLTTMKELLFFLESNGVIDAMNNGSTGAYEEIMSKKDDEGNTVIKKAISILKSNPRASGIIAALNELSVSIMAGVIGEDSSITYESVKEGLNDLIAIPDDLPEEEYKETVKETLGATLTSNNIEISDEMLDEVTDKVSEYLKDNEVIPEGTEELSDEQINDILLQYYDAYLDYKDTGVTPDNFPGLNTDSTD